MVSVLYCESVVSVVQLRWLFYSLKIEKLQLVLMTMPGVLRANLTYIYIGISIIRMGKTRSIRVGLHLLCAFYNNTVQKLRDDFDTGWQTDQLA